MCTAPKAENHQPNWKSCLTCRLSGAVNLFGFSFKILPILALLGITVGLTACRQTIVEYQPLPGATGAKTGYADAISKCNSKDAPWYIVPADKKWFRNLAVSQILVETRELAHARMARPVDLDTRFWGLAPTGLLPAAGAVAVPLELQG